MNRRSCFESRAIIRCVLVAAVSQSSITRRDRLPGARLRTASNSEEDLLEDPLELVLLLCVHQQLVEC